MEEERPSFADVPRRRRSASAMPRPIRPSTSAASTPRTSSRMLTALAFGTRDRRSTQIHIEGIAVDHRRRHRGGRRARLPHQAARRRARRPTAASRRASTRRMVAENRRRIAEVRASPTRSRIDGDCVGSLLLVGPGRRRRAHGVRGRQRHRRHRARLLRAAVRRAAGKLKPSKRAEARRSTRALITCACPSTTGPAPWPRSPSAWPSATSRSKASCSARPAWRGRRASRDVAAPCRHSSRTTTTEDAIRAALGRHRGDGNVAERPQMIRIERDIEPPSDRTCGRREPHGHGGRMSPRQRAGGLDRILVLEVVRVTERRPSPPRACAAAATRRPPTRRPSTPCAASSTELHIHGTSRHRRGRARRGADALHRREGRQGRRTEGRHRRRPAGRHDASAPRPCRMRSRCMADRREGRACSTRPTSTWTRSPSVPGYPEGIIDLDEPARPTTSTRWPRPRACRPHEITACILDRPRHAELIEAVREAGAARRLITDGDIAGVIYTDRPERDRHRHLSRLGGAPEGVLAAAALRCIGGQMQGRLHPRTTEEERARPRQDGHHRHQAQVSHAGDGVGRRDLLGDRRD